MPAPRDARRQATAIEFAIALVAARSRPEKHLREKLGARYAAGEADAAIARMRELGMVDDAAWAQRFARDRFERAGKGRHRIRAELLARGIDAATAEAALAVAFGEDAERAKAASVLESMRDRLTRDEGAADTVGDHAATDRRTEIGRAHV